MRALVAAAAHCRIRKLYSRCTRVHEIAIERNIVARHLRFVSHEGPIGLSQVFLNRDYNGYGLATGTGTTAA